MTKKYKLTNETIEVNGKTLYRIIALRNFAGVKAGDKGGFVESEKNLSQIGNCWIFDNAIVCNNACIYHNAEVRDNAQVRDKVRVFDDAVVFNNAYLYGNAQIYGKARVYGEAQISGYAQICDFAQVCNNAAVCDHAIVCDYAQISGYARAIENVYVCGKVHVLGVACLRGNAIIKNIDDYIVFKNWWSSGRYFTWTRSNDMWNVGCFYGTGEELVKRAYESSELSGREYERIVNYVNQVKDTMHNNSVPA